MYKENYIFLLIAFLIHSCVIAQDRNSFFLTSQNWEKSDSNKLTLEIDNTNFFKNNEYMADFKQGYTAPGYIFHPTIAYYTGEKTKLSAGTHMIHFFGDDGFYEIKPVIRVQHAFSSQIQVVVGEIFGHLHHQIIDPVFEFDHYFFHNIEEGLQLLIKTPAFTGDLWLNCENFIYWGDTDLEKGTLGFSGELHLLNNNPSFKVDIPLQAIICHEGGQIDATDEPLETLTNLVPGLQLNFYPGTYVQMLCLEGYFLYYKNLSFTKQLVFDEGYGFYPAIHIKTRHFNWQSYYWGAYKYFGPRGDQIYSSISSYKAYYAEEYRNMLINKLSYIKDIGQGISTGIFTEYYYDIDFNTLDYNYGLYLRFKQRFFLKNIKVMD